MGRLLRIEPLRDNVIIPLVIAEPEGGLVRRTRLAAPWTWKNPTMDIGEGMVAARADEDFRTSSPRCFKKLDFQ